MVTVALVLARPVSVGRPGSGRPSALVPRGVGAGGQAASLLVPGAGSLLGGGSMCKLWKHFQL